MVVPVAVSSTYCTALPPLASVGSGMFAGCPAASPSTPPPKPLSRSHSRLRAVAPALTRYPA